MKRRLFTPQGKFVGWDKLHRGVFTTLQAVIRKLFGKIPEVPWIPISARYRIEKILQPNSIVWEVGAGLSTLWLSSRAKKVTSIEASREWFDNLSEKIRKRKIKNIDLRFEWEARRMSSFEELEDECLDLLFIDGGPRAECLVNGFRKVKRGGHIYLDNWENTGFWTGAEEFLNQQAGQISKNETFIDYVPAQVGVYESLLIQKK